MVLRCWKANSSSVERSEKAGGGLGFWNRLTLPKQEQPLAQFSSKPEK